MVNIVLEASYTIVLVASNTIVLVASYTILMVTLNYILFLYKVIQVLNILILTLTSNILVVLP